MGASSSREIRTLLTTPSDSLDANLQRLGAELPEADTEAPTPETAYAALRAVARYYRGLARNIRAITPSPPAKADVLDALQRLDAALKLFEQGLRAGNTDAGQATVAEAARRTQAAYTDLAQATAALA